MFWRLESDEVWYMDNERAVEYVLVSVDEEPGIVVESPQGLVGAPLGVEQAFQTLFDQLPMSQETAVALFELFVERFCEGNGGKEYGGL